MADTSPTLVVGPAWVGDMIMAQGLLKRLISDRPESEIHLAAPQSTLPLADFMPEVSRTWLLNARHGELALAARWKLAATLAKEGFSRAYVLPNTFKSALLPWLARVPVRIGWKGEMRYGLLNDLRTSAGEMPRMVDRYLALAEPETARARPLLPPRLITDAARVAATLGRFSLKLSRPACVLCPGGDFGPAKRWPGERFREAARELLDEGYQIWILGGPEDAETGRSISSLCGEIINLAGETSLAEAVEILSAASVAVCNDTGLMHAAAALGLPLVVLYGSTTPDFTPPLTDRSQLLMQQLACRPCFERVCPLGHTRCLTEIPASRVVAATKEIMQEIP